MLCARCAARLLYSLRASALLCSSITPTHLESLARASLPTNHLSAVLVDDNQLYAALVYGSAINVLALHDLQAGIDKPCATWLTPDSQLIEQARALYSFPLHQALCCCLSPAPGKPSELAFAT